MNMDNYCMLPVLEGWISKRFKAGSHLGIDLGWIEVANCNIFAVQDGVVVDCGYGSEIGEYCVLQHNYSDGTHRWSGYIHMVKNSLKVDKGDNVKRGDVLGLRGNTGLSNGVHLHLYLTQKTTANYTWNTMKANSIDPEPNLYLDKKYNTGKFDSADQWNPYPTIVYPEPVERNEDVKQIFVNSETRRLREAPAGETYPELCTKGLYNVYEVKTAKLNGTDYDWCLIDTIEGNQFWVAKMSGDTLYEPIDYHEKYNEEVIKNRILENKLARIKAICEE